MSKAKKPSSSLYQTFVGSYIRLVVKGINITEGDRSSNMMFGGYLLDEDDDYYFLGQTPEAVYAAVRKSDVVTLMLSDEASDLMSYIEVPDGQEVQ